MKPYQTIPVFNVEPPPYPREGLFHLEMSEYCQVNRWLRHEAGRLDRIHQLDAIASPEELRRFQRKLRREVRRKAGCVYDPALPLAVREFGTIRRDGYTIAKLIYQSRPGVFVTALLYRPEGKGPFPAVLQMHGHAPKGKFGERTQRLSTDLVRSGFVVLAVDAFGVYERASHYCRGENHGSVQGAALLNLGETLLGAQVVDNMRGVDLLASLPEVSAARIGAVGASGGGNQTMWLAALDPRIQAAMPVVSVGSFESYVYGMNCLCELLPDGLTLSGEAGVLALIAPRPLRICNALYDCNHDFSPATMFQSYRPVERLYRALGAAEKLSNEIVDQPHGLLERARESALGFFAWALKGEGNGAPRPEPEADEIPEEELRLFPSHEERPAEVVTISEYCRRRGEELHEAMLKNPAVDRKRAVRELKAILRLPALPPARLHRYAAVDGIERCALDAGYHLLPFLVKRGKPGKVFRIVLHPEGKANFTPGELAAAGGDDGATLVLPDLFGTGETAQPNPTIGLHHQFFRQLLWIGHSLMGEWVLDLLLLARSLRRDFGAAEVEISGLREGGIAALFAAVFDPGIARVTAIDAPASLRMEVRRMSFLSKGPFAKFLDGAIYSLALAFPGFLQWGDISLAAALAGGEKRVEFRSPRCWDGTPLTPAETAAFRAEIARFQP